MIRNLCTVGIIYVLITTGCQRLKSGTLILVTKDNNQITIASDTRANHINDNSALLDGHHDDELKLVMVGKQIIGIAGLHDYQSFNVNELIKNKLRPDNTILQNANILQKALDNSYENFVYQFGVSKLMPMEKYLSTRVIIAGFDRGEPKIYESAVWIGFTFEVKDQASVHIQGYGPELKIGNGPFPIGKSSNIESELNKNKKRGKITPIKNLISLIRKQASKDITVDSAVNVIIINREGQIMQQHFSKKQY